MKWQVQIQAQIPLQIGRLILTCRITLKCWHTQSIYTELPGYLLEFITFF